MNGVCRMGAILYSFVKFVEYIGIKYFRDYMDSEFWKRETKAEIRDGRAGRVPDLATFHSNSTLEVNKILFLISRHNI